MTVDFSWIFLFWLTRVGDGNTVRYYMCKSFHTDCISVWGDSHMLPSKGCKGLGGLPYTIIIIIMLPIKP
jgi:hypothetical protein